MGDRRGRLTRVGACSDLGHPPTGSRFTSERSILPPIGKELRGFFAAACAPWEERIFKIFLLSGMRRGELENLEWTDVRLDLGLIVIQAKTSGSRRPASGSFRSHRSTLTCSFSIYRERRSDRWVAANRAGNRDTHLLGKLKKICRKAGIAPAASTVHALRHSFAAHLRMAGVSLETPGSARA